MNNRNLILLIIGFVLLLIGVLSIVTLPAYLEIWDFSDTGDIGSTIGGITAPFINILGAVLIYISFRDQNKANKIQANQNNFNLLHDLYKEIKDDFNDLTFSSASLKKGKIYKGRKALSVFTEILQVRLVVTDFRKNSFFNEFNFLLGSISIFLDLTAETTLDSSDKKIIMRLIHFLYLTKIQEDVKKIIEFTEDSSLHKDFHNQLKGISDKINANYKHHFPEK